MDKIPKNNKREAIIHAVLSYKKPCKIWTSEVSYIGAKIVQCKFLKNKPNFDGGFLDQAKFLIVFLIFG